MVRFNLILAADRKLGIGLNNALPWNLKKDLRHFQTVTQLLLNRNKKMNSVIMGRKTFESINSQPLANRLNIVVSRNATSAKLNPKNLENVMVARDMETVEQMLMDKDDQIDQNFIVGGKTLYEESIQMQNTLNVYLTRVWKEFQTDVNLDPSFEQVLKEQYVLSETTKTFRENGVSYDFQRFIRKTQSQEEDGVANKNYLQRMQQKLDKQIEQKQNPQILYTLYKKHEEYQYLEYLDQIMKNGVSKNDRTQIGVVSQFGGQMRFDLSETFPLLTTKRTFMRGISEELLWFIKGSTNSNILRDKGVHIWDGNSSREFLDDLGFTEREVGDLGPVYGFQWRHCGAEYVNMHHDYTGKGIDQLANAIRNIKEQPESRRIIMSAWNVNDISKMALPPCHILVQFYISNNRLSCILYQRSCDMGLGVPFNIASYALLTCMIAQVCELERGEFIHCMGDMHVYNNHIEPLQKQLKRTPRPFPYLELNKEIKDINEFKMEDIKVIDYEPLNTIKMQMAV